MDDQDKPFRIILERDGTIRTEGVMSPDLIRVLSELRPGDLEQIDAVQL